MCVFSTSDLNTSVHVISTHGTQIPYRVLLYFVCKCVVFRIVGKHSTKSLPRLNQQCSPLYFLLRHNLNKKQKEGDNANEDEQVAEDEELAADVEGVPQAQPELLHLGSKYLVAHLEEVQTFVNSLFASYSCTRVDENHVSTSLGMVIC